MSGSKGKWYHEQARQDQLENLLLQTNCTGAGMTTVVAQY